MAQVVYDFPVQELHGKVCKHQKVIFTKNKLSGKLFTSQICNPSTKAPSADQLTQLALFKAASDYAKQWMNKANTAKFAAATKRFEDAKKAGTTKYLTLRTYLMGESFDGDQVDYNA